MISLFNSCRAFLLTTLLSISVIFSCALLLLVLLCVSFILFSNRGDALCLTLPLFLIFFFPLFCLLPTFFSLLFLCL